MIDFKNKKILITGATGGIGQSLVKKFVNLQGNVLATGTKIEKLNLLKNNFPNINILRFDIPGLKTIITPQKPNIIATQLIKLSFSFKINFANIRRKKGVVINNIVKILIGICLSEKNTTRSTGIKLKPLKIGT